MSDLTAQDGLFYGTPDNHQALREGYAFGLGPLDAHGPNHNLLYPPLGLTLPRLLRAVSSVVNLCWPYLRGGGGAGLTRVLAVVLGPFQSHLYP